MMRRPAPLLLLLALAACGDKAEQQGAVGTEAIVDLGKEAVPLVERLPEHFSTELPHEAKVKDLYAVDADAVCFFMPDEPPINGGTNHFLNVFMMLRHGDPKPGADHWYMGFFKNNGQGDVIRNARGILPAKAGCAPYRTARIRLVANEGQLGTEWLDPVVIELHEK